MEKQKNTTSNSIKQKTIGNKNIITASNINPNPKNKQKLFITRGTNSLYIENIDDTQNRPFV